MTPAQARNLLALIADLYAVANTPEPPPVQPQPNGVEKKQAVRT